MAKRELEANEDIYEPRIWNVSLSVQNCMIRFERVMKQ